MNLKNNAILFLCAATAFSCVAAPEVPTLRFGASEVEVLVAPNAPSATRFAAREMTNFLSRVLGARVPIVRKPSAGKTAVVMGTNSWSAAAGVDPSALRRDGFVIKVDPAAKRVYVAGCDDPAYDLIWAVANVSPDPWGTGNSYERATVFATYGFLERFAGVRFYFPGEMGTVVPRADMLTLPATEIRSEPDWSCRIVFTVGFGKWPDDLPKKEVRRLSHLEQLRLRTQTESYNSCHGQYWMNMAKRFGESHPEYFALSKTGKRLNNPCENGRNSQHLCQSSAVWDEMFLDAKSYFLGEPPEKRGVIRGFGKKAKVAWGGYCRYRKYYDVMPNDGHPECRCDRCQAAYAKYRDPESRMRMSDLVWRQTVRLANRLRKEGISGTVLQAAYARYRDIPEVDIPDNVIVNLCQPGPWTEHEGPAAMKKELDLVKAWSRKAGGRLWMWIYLGKFDCFKLDFPDLPNSTPRALARYLKNVAPHVLGVFPQPSSDWFIYQFLDFYIYSRIAWDNDCDVDAVLSEYYRLMYGAGGKNVERISDILENLWISRIVGKKTPTSWGYSYDSPDMYTVFKDVYTQEVMAELDGLYEKALAAVPAGSMEARRIEYVCGRMLAPLRKRVREFPVSIAPSTELEWRAAHPGESLLTNGSFDSVEGWVNYSGNGTVCADTDVFFSAPSSIRLSSVDDSPLKTGPFCRVAAVQKVKLKPSTTYRLSGFWKTENVKGLCVADGGADFLVSGPVAKGFPLGRNATGTRDWHRFVYEFTTPGNYTGLKDANVGPRLVLSYGTVWVDDIRLEEIKGAPETAR